MARIIIVFLGGPGAGKGTQAQALIRYLRIPQISTGDLLRAEVRSATDLGREIEKQLSSGKLVSDVIVNQLLAARVKAPDCENGFMLDGYPRTLNQAVALQSQLRPRDKFVVIEIEVDPELIIERMLSRLTCSGCGCVYNTGTLKPQVEGQCDSCGGKLIHRSDDNEAVIRERFRTFSSQTSPLRDYFKQLGVYARVDGMRPSEEVTLDILTVLDIEGIVVSSPVSRRV
ncbi:MAG: adenylate kinase [Acidobacteria bacterium]|nr:adenylate kinase [Acidobacteriota bacterium]